MPRARGPVLRSVAKRTSMVFTRRVWLSHAEGRWNGLRDPCMILPDDIGDPALGGARKSVRARQLVCVNSKSLSCAHPSARRGLPKP